MCIVYLTLVVTYIYYMLFMIQQTSCSYSKSYRGASISGIIRITSGSENGLQAAVASTGPVSVAVDGKSNAFKVSR